MNAKHIQQALNRYYMQGAKYIVPNCYFFSNGYAETDLLIVKPSGMVYDIEVKISRSDFKADFKKEIKHSILSNGSFTDKSRKYRTGEDGCLLPDLSFDIIEKEIISNDRPHRFYFAVPADLITVHEIPEYAGLLYISAGGNVTKIKEGRLLHKDAVDTDKRLCQKFYYYWQNALAKQTITPVK